jgi:hypothetical protein
VINVNPKAVIELETLKQKVQHLESQIEAQRTPEASGNAPLGNQGLKENGNGKSGFAQEFKSQSDMINYLCDKRAYGTNEEKVYAKQVLEKLEAKAMNGLKQCQQTLTFEDDFSSVNPQTGHPESLLKRQMRLANERLRNQRRD